MTDTGREHSALESQEREDESLPAGSGGFAAHRSSTSPQTVPGRHGLRETVPLVFGAERSLLGILTLPASDRALATGVVFCAPLWHQNICSYRPLRTLALRLAERGLPVLRFDWPGCGDSLDHETPAGGAAIWQTALAEAIEELQARTGVTDVALLGLRIGATFALLEATRNPVVNQVVALAPYAAGRSYIRELRAFEALAEQNVYSEPQAERTPLPPGTLETGGFLVTEAELEALRAIDLARSSDWPRVPPRALLATTHLERATTALAGALGAAGSEVTTLELPELAHLWEASQVSYLPQACSVPVGEWLVAAAKTARADERPSSPRPAETPRLDGAGFVDRAEMIETAQGAMLAITCLPTAASRHSRDWVVFLNTGRIRRVGTNRLSTIWARRWARAGTPSLRLDVRGVGDSEGFAVGDEAHFDEPRVAFRPSVMVDLSAAFAWLAEHHQAERFTVIGLSSGGTLAYQLALHDARVTGVAMINPPALYWDDRLQLLRAWDDARKGGAGPPALYRAARSHGVRWTQKALQGSLLSLRGETPTKWDRRRALESLTRFQAEGRRVGAVFTSGDRGLRYFERALGADYLDQFDRLGVLVEVIAGPDHTFRPLWSHAPLTDFLERLLEQAGFLDRPGDAEAAAPARP